MSVFSHFQLSAKTGCMNYNSTTGSQFYITNDPYPTIGAYVRSFSGLQYITFPYVSNRKALEDCLRVPVDLGMLTDQDLDNFVEFYPHLGGFKESASTG